MLRPAGALSSRQGDDRGRFAARRLLDQLLDVLGANPNRNSAGEAENGIALSGGSGAAFAELQLTRSPPADHNLAGEVSFP